VRELAVRGARDIVVVDIAAPPEDAMFAGSRYVYGDVRRPIDPALASGPALVVNLAAVHRTPGHADHEYFETNVTGAQNVVRFCEATGSRRLWFTSSISPYGPSEEPKSEDATPAPVSAYGKSKLEAETIHRAWVERGGGRRLIIARPAVVFGARENGNFTRLARAMRRGVFVYPGRTDTVKGCGYVADLVGSFFFMDGQPEDFILYPYLTDLESGLRRWRADDPAGRFV